MKDISTLETQVLQALNQSRQLVDNWLRGTNNEANRTTTESSTNGIQGDSEAKKEDYAKQLRPLPSATVGLGSQAALESEQHEDGEQSFGKKKATNQQQSIHASQALSSVQKSIERRRRLEAGALAGNATGKGTRTADKASRTGPVRGKGSGRTERHRSTSAAPRSSPGPDSSDDEEESRNHSVKIPRVVGKGISKKGSHSTSLLDMYKAKHKQKQRKE